MLQGLPSWFSEKLTLRKHAFIVDPAVEAMREATYPPPYPAGWYVVARSEDVADRPLFVRYADQNLVVFRDTHGQVGAIDAYCPHLGANLADGQVHGDSIECPFHGWRIDTKGRVAENRNGNGYRRCEQQTPSWAVDELHGWVCVYHRHDVTERGPASEPPYRLQRVAEIDQGDLLFRGEYDAGQVHMHLVEFAENSVDFQHFAAIHGKLRLPWTSIPVPGMTIEHEARWRRDETEPHVCWFENEAHLAFRGTPIPKSGAFAKVRLDGPGGIIRFDFKLNRRPGRVVMFQSHTPLAPLTQHVRFRWFSEPRVPKRLASFIVGNWVSQWQRDIGIWERKIYRQRPPLSRGDGPVHQLRRWYSQFYSEPA